MEQNDKFEDQITMIDFIVRSITEVMPLLKYKEINSDVISNTMSVVFRYLNKLIKQIPEIIISSSIPQPRQELLENLTRVISLWQGEQPVGEELANTWEEFSFWWDEFFRIFNSLIESDRTIILSMN